MKENLREERDPMMHRSRGSAPGRTKARSKSPRQEIAWLIQQTRMVEQANGDRYEGLGEAGKWLAPIGTCEFYSKWNGQPFVLF